jgi:hypothetical protein
MSRPQLSVAATKALSPLLGAASYRQAVKQLLTSVVREICMLRSVGAGERVTAPGHPVAISDGRPYRDSNSRFQLVGIALLVIQGIPEIA